MKLILTLFFVFGLIFPAQAELKVVASIAPLAGMIKKIGGENVEVVTLLPHLVSAHYYHAKPSDMVKISEADLIFWMGPNLEYYFAKPFDRAIEEGKVVGMMQYSDLELYATRKGGAWSHMHDHNGKGVHDHGYEDPHIWLSYKNSIKMIDHIAQKMVFHDKENMKGYLERAALFKKEVEAFYLETKALFKPYQNIPFLVAHDGYQYFEKTYGLNGLGSISVSHDQSLSPHRVKEISDLIRKKKAACIFTEPYTSMPLIENIAEQENIFVGFLDPLGSGLPNDQNYYLSLLGEMRDNFLKCFHFAEELDD